MSTSTPPSWKESLLHHAAAWGAALCALGGLWHGWTIPWGGRDWSLRIWPGHLLLDVLQVAIFTLTGLVLGGWWWWAAAWRRGVVGIAGSLGLLTMGIGAVNGWLPQQTVCIAALALVLWAAVSAIFFRRSRPERLKSWFSEHRSWNAVFFAGFVLLNTASDVLMIGQAPPGWLATTGFIAARFLTQLVVACIVWCLLMLGERWWPRGAGWVGWGGLALAPLLIFTDIQLRQMWTMSLFRLCTQLETGGKLNLLKIKEGAGVDLTTTHILLLTLLILAAPAWYFFSRWISRRRGFRISGARLSALALTAWVMLMLLNVVESALKSREWRNWESREIALQLTPFARPRGIANFNVQAANPLPKGPATVQRRPDIFLFIVETMRADVLDPVRTPNLVRFKADCQPLTETRAGSNSTHLSWFSILHGRLPYYFEEARKVSAPAPMLSLMKSAGYSVEVRTAGNLDYEQMLTSNFGDGSMMQVMEHVPDSHPERPLTTPERERLMMRRLQTAVDNSSSGSGILRLTAMDSAHYPYQWPSDWKPPYSEYERDPVFPVMASTEEVEQVRRRYWNAISWNDHLIGEFIEWLKSRRRYDDALIIITGDHGEEFKEHGSWFHCSALNPEQTRVPILIKWPEDMGPGPALADASHLDLLPTILDAVGVSESCWEGMPGRSLKREGDSTSVITTCYGSQNGETMVWRRNGWEAAFSWSSPWVLAPPRRMWLERLEGPEGRVECAGPAEYEKELHRRFPDAAKRVFSSWRRTE
jgi:glucan phosphoethanolaminetransferase (alkaline phosphatase superfamily)